MSNKPNHEHKTAKERLARIRAVVPPVATRFKKPTLQQQTEEALSNVPRITNETVAEHREQVLRGARKYKYPLQHSKHKIVIVSTALLVVAIVMFLLGSILNLYKFQSTTRFMYRVTQIVPFPVAKVGKYYVSYENYLFEMRRYMHYYRTQQQVDFASESGQLQLANYKPQAMQKVIDDLYVKNLASQNGLSVSDGEVQDALGMLRIQNRLSSDQELESVISRFYGWSINDMRRELKQEILGQKVAATLDKETAKKASDVALQVKSGADFAALAAANSDDQSTKGNGGQYNDTAIGFGSQEVASVIVRELARLKPGETSGVIRTSTSYEIVKLLEVSNGKYKAAHIQMNFKPISTFTTVEAKNYSVREFISVPDVADEPIPQPAN